MRGFVLTFIFTLSLSSAACHGAEISDQLTREVKQRQGATAGEAPRVGAEFRSELAQLAAEGLRMKEALEAGLEGGARHLAAIFERPDAREPSQRFEFRIIESDGRAAKTVFRRTEFFFSFAATRELNRLNATDINGDGSKEILVQSSSGGNCWSCNPTEIYQVRNHKGVLIAAGPIQQIADLDGDGVQELLVTDTRWESYDDLSHAASPSAVMVYAWRDGKYVFAARDFAAYYKAEVERLRAAVAEARAQITAEDYSDEAYVGQSIALAITYAHMGDADRGLKELETLLSSNARSAEQSKRRAAVMEDFRKGESAKKLRGMKYGDALPTG
ncbi:MAG: FG-GAP repeat domain-containing protein [Blastocatellia bacterium]